MLRYLRIVLKQLRLGHGIWTIHHFAWTVRPFVTFDKHADWFDEECRKALNSYIHSDWFDEECRNSLNSYIHADWFYEECRNARNSYINALSGCNQLIYAETRYDMCTKKTIYKRLIRKKKRASEVEKCLFYVHLNLRTFGGYLWDRILMIYRISVTTFRRYKMTLFLKTTWNLISCVKILILMTLLVTIEQTYYCCWGRVCKKLNNHVRAIPLVMSISYTLLVF